MILSLNHWVSQVLISASSEPCRAVVDRDMWPFWRLIKSVSRHGMLVCLYGFIDLNLNVYIMWQMVKRKMVMHQSFNYSNCWLYQFILIQHTLQKRRTHFFRLFFCNQRQRQRRRRRRRQRYWEHWGKVTDSQRVTLTAFAILAMFALQRPERH